MKKLGLITYHAAYNFGSALQAYATQKCVENFDCECEIINYRMPEQKKFYTMYRTKYGVKRFVRDLTQFSIHNKRKLREKSFEKFFYEYFRLTKEMSEPSQIEELWNDYEVVISGSDQIWNKHSNELNWNEWRYMEPYLLKGFEGKKISYASSVGNMTDEELLCIREELISFDYIAMREQTSAERINDLLNRNVETVCDPTLLLTGKQWINNLGLQQNHDDDYVLYYSLDGLRSFTGRLQVVNMLAKEKGCKVKVTTPFAYTPFHDSNIEFCPEMGPREFIESIYNAKMIVTNSYHGTILAVNFEKDFYSICKEGGAEFRKTDILKRIGLEDRIIYDISVLTKQAFQEIDYQSVRVKLEELRQHSLNYLRTALNG